MMFCFLLSRLNIVCGQRIRVALGEITLDAITIRVLQITREKYPFLASLKPDSMGLSSEDLRTKNDHSFPAAELREGLCYFLVEFTQVIATVTGDILTP